MATARRLARGAGAALVLLALVAGPPVVLWIVAGGSPVPDRLPSLDDVSAALSLPDYTGSLLLGVMKYVAWVGWAGLVWIIGAETVAAITHRPARASGVRARPVPGLSGPQRLVATLVAAVLLGAGTQVAQAQATTTARPALVPAVAAPVEAPAPLARAAAPAVPDPGGTQPATRTVTVAKGDSFWELANRHLGDPTRWTEIFDLNAGRTMTTGHVMEEPGWLEPGWELLVPDTAGQAAPEAPPPQDQTTTRTVQRGDTLSQIAEEELGDANRYPELFAATTGTVQPDGRHLVDPDLIYPGWNVTLPGDAASAQADRGQAGATPGDQDPVRDHQAVSAEPGTAGQDVQADEKPAADEGVAAPQSQAGAEQTSPGTQNSTGADQWAPWVLGGLTGAGAVLAGSLWLALRARRRAQRRHRRPGRTLAAPSLLLAPVEKTVVTVGSSAAQTVEYLDAVLRRLGAAVATSGGAMPDLVAVELTGADVVLHLGGPWELGAPWEGADGGHRWQVPVGLPLDRVGPAGDHPAPYPLLVTVGSADDGSVWLFNLEDLAVTLTGEAERAQDFARYLVAEIGCSPWSAWTTVDCVGLGAELVGLNPDRIRYHDPQSAGDPVGNALAEAMTTVGRATAARTDVVTARSRGVGVESWAPQVVLVDATSDDPALDPLLDIVAGHAGCTGTSVVLAGSRPRGGGVRIEVTAEGRVRLPEVGLDLVAVGLDITEAGGCAGLVAHTEIAVDPVPVPYQDDTMDIGWWSWSDQSGALRPEHTLPRTSDSRCDPQATSSLLPGDDASYVELAATTPDDLALLAPQVPTGVRREVDAADPGLDEDLAAWFAPGTTRPRVRVLGSVQVAAPGVPPTRRQPFFAELVVYLALHPAGAAPARMAEAFSTSRAKAREYVRIVRQWLGVDPATGVPYLHEDDQEVCQVDVLCDLDLFRRLRVRGQARGAEGTDDLLAALRLVAGRPFDGRQAGWAWLVDDRTDEAALVAVIDTAHTVVTGALATADLPVARWAAQAAQVADPYDEVIRLDLAAVASAEGRYAEAARIVTHDIGNRTDDGHAPPDLSDRTQEIISAHLDWCRPRAS